MNEVATELTLEELEMVEGGTKILHGEKQWESNDAVEPGSSYQPNIVIWKTAV